MDRRLDLLPAAAYLNRAISKSVNIRPYYGIRVFINLQRPRSRTDGQNGRTERTASTVREPPAIRFCTESLGHFNWDVRRRSIADKKSSIPRRVVNRDFCF